MSEDKAKYTVPASAAAPLTDEQLVTSIQFEISQLNLYTDMAMERGISIEIESLQKADQYDAKLSVTKFVLRHVTRRLWSPSILTVRQ